MADEKTIKKRLSIRGLLGSIKRKLKFTEADRLNAREDELSPLLKRLNKLTTGSKATGKDVDKLARSINKRIAKRHKKK